MPGNDQVRTTMKEVITFILPTRNRKRFIRRAIDSCLACENDVISPFVIVIDGESDDGSFSDLQAVYGNDARVQLLQNSKSAGFMSTCFEGVGLVKSKWVTFMYDDDVLSPYFQDMVRQLMRSSATFIMGYGVVYPADQVYPFKPIETFQRHKAKELMRTYYGRSRALEFIGLPQSPICCVTTIDVLDEWMAGVKGFCSKNPLRLHFMLRRNIGPDLMIYFLSLVKHQGQVPLAVAVVAQFSEHPTSMSVQYGASDLAVGYWLAKIWGFEYYCETGSPSDAATCGSAVLLIGGRILVTRLSRFKLEWSAMIVLEMVAVIGWSIRNRFLLRTMKEGYLHVFDWVRMRAAEPIPRR
jgi:glycosyltransferase involved in cell wall biosynthesis